MKKGKIIILILSIFTVLSAGVSGRGDIYVPTEFETIQEAIDVAVDGDVIIVSPGVYEENINFLGKAITVGSLYHTTQDTSYISQTVIDGGQNGRVVTFNSEEGNNSVLTGFTIKNGYASGRGGGIFADDYCSPTLNNLKICDNHATSLGGGFYFGESCTGVLSDLLVENNSAQYGGGGTYWYYCNLIMEDSVIRNNEATYSGGGICTSSATLHFEDVLIEGNTAGNDGGGFYTYWGESTLKNVFIHQNQAERGGGICSESNLNLENVTITDNYAEEICGGLYTYCPVNFAEELQKRCSIYLNEAGIYYGKDIYSSPYDTLEVYLTTFSVLYPNSVYASPMNKLSFDIFMGIIPQIDTAIYVSPDGDDVNSGLSAGSAFKTIRQALSVALATEEEPGTIYLGEGIYSPTTTGESFPIYLTENTTICGENRDNVILDAEGNSTVFQLEEVYNVKISGLTITNGFNYTGGGIYSWRSDFMLENMIISDNQAQSTGGGIYLYGSSSMIKNLIMADNSAGSTGGGISIVDEWNQSSHLDLANVTITNNFAENYGNGIYSSSNSDILIVNSIIGDNMPGKEIYMDLWFSRDILIAFSDVENGDSAIDGDAIWLFGSITDDPLFVDAENGNYALQEGSPCIDAGIAYFEYVGDLLVDMEEDEYYGSAPDMGAYEYIPVVNNDNEGIVEQPGSLCVYPNPFNPETMIKYQLPEAGKTSIEVYNIRGQKMAVLVNEKQEAGEHSFRWDAAGQNSGIYFVQIRSSAFEDVKKVILLK